MTEEEREAWDIVAQGLEETGEYRVIRKLRPVERYAKADGEPVETGLVLDTETTGLDAQADEVIELGMILFEYAPATGKVYRVMGVFDELRDPGRRIPREIVEMTHITDAMVRGAPSTPEPSSRSSARPASSSRTMPPLTGPSSRSTGRCSHTSRGGAP